jgi:hypothetical protein
VVGLVAAVALVGLAIRLKHRNDLAASAGGTTPPVTAPASSPATVSSSPAAAVALTPAQVVQRYFRLLNEHHYLAAWNLGGKNNGSKSFPDYVDGYSGTANSSVEILSVSGNVVTARLTATQSDNTVKVFQGTYTVQDGVITQFNVTRTA